MAASGILASLGQGFVVGALAAVTFHQAGVGLFHAADLYPVAPFDLAPRPPLGVPGIVSAAFWSGVWGMVIVPFALPWLSRLLPASLAGFLLGAIPPVLVLFLVVAPLQGQPIAYAQPLGSILRITLVHGIWGLGMVWLAFGLGASGPRAATP